MDRVVPPHDTSWTWTPATCRSAKGTIMMMVLKGSCRIKACNVTDWRPCLKKGKATFCTRDMQAPAARQSTSLKHPALCSTWFQTQVLVPPGSQDDPGETSCDDPGGPTILTKEETRLLWKTKLALHQLDHSHKHQDLQPLRIWEPQAMQQARGSSTSYGAAISNTHNLRALLCSIRGNARPGWSNERPASFLVASRLQIRQWQLMQAQRPLPEFPQ